jgi:hypothetical protein
MPRDPGLEELVKSSLGNTRGLSEKPMFGGWAYLLHGNLLIGARRAACSCASARTTNDQLRIGFFLRCFPLGLTQDTKFLLFSLVRLYIGIILHPTKMNHVANLNVLAPATLTRGMDVKAVHQIGALQYIDPVRRFDCVRAAHRRTYWGMRTASICRLLSAEGDNLSLQRVLFVVSKR